MLMDLVVNGTTTGGNLLVRRLLTGSRMIPTSINKRKVRMKSVLLVVKIYTRRLLSPFNSETQKKKPLLKS